VDWARGSDSRIELDLAKCAFVIGDVLLQNRRQCLRLLRAEIDTLKIPDFNLSFRLLLHGPEYQEKVPDIYPHLHAVGISFAILIGIYDGEIWLRRNSHMKHSLSGTGRGGEGEAG
jgi:hypothetical protein